MSDPLIIARGNIEDGFDLIGPFDDVASALSYAERKFNNLECKIFALIPPDIDEPEGTPDE